jgi:plasmid stabilization system protein ParE
MRYRVLILRRAESDLGHFLDWLTDRSLAGAEHWYVAYRQCIEGLANDPRSFPLFDEYPDVTFPIHQCFFRTRRGRRYRVLFVIVGSEVRILRIRGPGQLPVTWDDLL